jgi:cytochrome c556
MKIVLGIAVLSVATIGCSARTATTTTTSGTGVTATTVANTAGAQAAAQLTPSDLESRMKRIGTTFPAMRMHLMGGMTADAVKEAQELATLFGDVERFWAQHKRDDAVKWAQDARTFAAEAAGAATANDSMKALQAANNMQGACKQCHGTYREMDPAGGFRIKPGVIAQP